MKRVKSSIFCISFSLVVFSLSLSLRKTSFSSTRRRRSTRSPRLSRGVNATLVLLLDESKVVVYTLFVMIVIVFVLLRETLFSFFYEETARIFESKHKIISLTWPTLKTSRDINSNETCKKTTSIERTFPCVSLARVSFLFIHFCVHLESVKDGQFSHFLLFFCSFWEKCFTGGGEFPYLKTSNTTRAYITIGIVYTHIFERRRQTI